MPVQSRQIFRAPTIAELKKTSVNVDYQKGQIVVFSRILCDLGFIPHCCTRKQISPNKEFYRNLHAFAKCLDAAFCRFYSVSGGINAFRRFIKAPESVQKRVLEFLGISGWAGLNSRDIEQSGAKFPKAVIGLAEFLSGFGVAKGSLRVVVRNFVGAYDAYCSIVRLPSSNSLRKSLFLSCVEKILSGDCILESEILKFFSEVYSAWDDQDGVNTMKYLQQVVENQFYTLKSDSAEIKLQDIVATLPKGVVENFLKVHKVNLLDKDLDFEAFYKKIYSPKSLTAILNLCGVEEKGSGVSRVNYELRIEKIKLDRASQRAFELKVALSSEKVRNRKRLLHSLEMANMKIEAASKKIAELQKKGSLPTPKNDGESCYCSFVANTANKSTCTVISQILKDGMKKVADSKSYSYDFISWEDGGFTRFIISFPKNSLLYRCLRKRGRQFLENVLNVVKEQVTTSQKTLVSFSKIVPLSSL